LLELTRYVVLNPVRAGMVKDPARYAWSSFRATTGETARPLWLTVDWVLAQFAKTRGAARPRYEEFVAAGKAAGSPWLLLKGQTLLGSESFVEKITPLLEDKAAIQEIPRTQRLAHRPTLKALFPRTVRTNKEARDEAINRVFSGYGYTMAAIARETGLHYSTVSKVIKGTR
jgi:hypothetical protein